MTKNLLSSDNLKKTAKKLLVAYVILQPIFDIYMCLFDEKIQIFGNSLATILRFLLAFLMAGLVIVSTIKTKLTKCFLLYVALIVIYTVIHHFNALGFSVPLTNAEYSVFSELIYLVRICIPPALIYVIINVKPDYKDVKLMVVSVATIISMVIIISNLFLFGHCSYFLDDVTIKGNMFSWFTNTDIEWRYLTCRGLFQWTNQVSAVMLINLPFLLYVSFKEKKILYWILTVIYLISMINLSTRIAAVGGILVFIGVVGLYIIENIISKKDFRKEIKNAGCILASVLIAITFLIYSPIMERSKTIPLLDDIITIDRNESKQSSTDNSAMVSSVADSSVADSSVADSSVADSSVADSSVINSSDTTSPNKEDNVKPLSKEQKIEFIKSNLTTAKINDIYILKAYPYTEDADFWYDIIVSVPEYARSGNRTMRSYMIKRIFERDGRFSNILFGISYTRSSSFVWQERDIETQLDSLGIVGFLLFMGPYFVAVIIGLWYFFKRFKENLKLSYCIYLISTVLALGVSYLSGHIMNEVFPFVYLALVAGMTITSAFNPEKRETE